MAGRPASTIRPRPAKIKARCEHGGPGWLGAPGAARAARGLDDEEQQGQCGLRQMWSHARPWRGRGMEYSVMRETWSAGQRLMGAFNFQVPPTWTAAATGKAAQRSKPGDPDESAPVYPIASSQRSAKARSGPASDGSSVGSVRNENIVNQHSPTSRCESFEENLSIYLELQIKE